MQTPVPAFIPMVLAALAITACSSPQVPSDRFNLSVRDPTAAVEAQADPNAEPGVNSSNPIVPQP
ncbi:putative lipoprotein YmbA [Inquilinus ginsengisoli]|jgi:hypothetical protein|uniref:hypothetical protein n=1 Tax=Inquilinus ginsengisoli TaxID=363840 RepID=UPI003D1DBDF4